MLDSRLMLTTDSAIQSKSIYVDGWSQDKVDTKHRWASVQLHRIES